MTLTLLFDVIDIHVCFLHSKDSYYLTVLCCLCCIKILWLSFLATAITKKCLSRLVLLLWRSWCSLMESCLKLLFHWLKNYMIFWMLLEVMKCDRRQMAVIALILIGYCVQTFLSKLNAYTVILYFLSWLWSLLVTSLEVWIAINNIVQCPWTESHGV